MTDINWDHLVLSGEEWIDVLAGLRARLGRTRADLYRLDERIVKAINE